MFVRTNAGVLDDVNVGHDDEDGDYGVLAERFESEGEQGVGEGEQGVVYELSDGEWKVLGPKSLENTLKFMKAVKAV